MVTAAELHRERRQRVDLGFVAGWLDGTDFLIVNRDRQPLGFTAVNSQTDACARAQLIQPKVVTQRSSVRSNERLSVALNVFAVVSARGSKAAICCSSGAAQVQHKPLVVHLAPRQVRDEVKVISS